MGTLIFQNLTSYRAKNKIEVKTTKKILHLVTSILALLILSACENMSFKSIDKTPTVVQGNIDVSGTPEKTIINHLGSNEVVTPLSCISENKINEFDPAIYEGIVIITQYYTYLGHGLYQEAYGLLSTSAKKHSPNFEDFKSMAEASFHSVQILKILPFFVWSCEQGHIVTPETGTETRFYVQIIAEGEGKMSGSVPSGMIQTLFLSLIKEDNEWKIDSYATIGQTN